MRLGARFEARPTVAQNVSASGVAASVTLAAAVDQSWCLEAIHLTYDGGTPGVKAITIAYTQNGAAVSVVIGISATALVTNIVEIAGRIVGDVNTAIVVTGALLTSQIATMEVMYN